MIMDDLLVLLKDKYEPHEVMEMLESVFSVEKLFTCMWDLIEASFCEEGPFEEEWRDLYGD